ncbi:MAG: carboxypeptidase regulatory-like domain-containing protein, partial [Gemmatimonadales bacterium]
MNRAALALLLTVGAASQAFPQSTGIVYGGVTDTAGKPIGQAWVRAVGTTGQTVTDQAGRFRIGRLPPGPITVWARAIGYRGDSTRVTVVSADSVRVDLRLASSPLIHDVVVVTAAKRSQLLDEAVTSVAEVSAEQLDRRAVLTVDEAVDKAPGVQVLNGQINVRGSSGYAQGLGSRVLLLLDG